MNLNQPAIVPWPKNLVMKTSSVSSSCEKKEQISNVLSPEAYTIRITPERILVEAGSKTGLQYAEYTLRQILLQYRNTLPCLEIRTCASCFPVGTSISAETKPPRAAGKPARCAKNA